MRPISLSDHQADDNRIQTNVLNPQKIVTRGEARWDRKGNIALVDIKSIRSPLTSRFRVAIFVNLEPIEPAHIAL